MKNNLLQAKTYQMRQAIQRSLSYDSGSSRRRTYVFNFLSSNRSATYALLLLLLAQTLIEIILVVSASGSLRDGIYSLFVSGGLGIAITIASAVVVIYLLVSFFALKKERALVLSFVNRIRRDWFASFLIRDRSEITNNTQADFIAKASYHLPLVTMGVDNSVLGLLRTVLSMSVIFLIALVGGGVLYLLAIMAILGSILVGATAWFVARHYVTREVASYSQVIRHIDQTLSERFAVRFLGFGKSALHMLDERVFIDTYFRIRRDVWLRYFNKAIFGIIFVVSIIAVIFGLQNQGSLFATLASDDIILVGALSIYAFRLIYESARTGLYIPPLLLGLRLSIPNRSGGVPGTRNAVDWSTIEFRSNKVKLHPNAGYISQVSMRFDRGKSYSVTGDPYSGKSSLAMLLSGNTSYLPNAWVVKVDNQRYRYREWVQQFSYSYLVTDSFPSELTLGEVITGKRKSDISSSDIDRIYGFAKLHPILSNILSGKRFVGESMRMYSGNGSYQMAVHVLRCLYSLPSLILIDSIISDSYPERGELIKVLRTELPSACLVVFSRIRRDILPFDYEYQISPGSILAK